jgi:hypothetical protein
MLKIVHCINHILYRPIQSLSCGSNPVPTRLVVIILKTSIKSLFLISISSDGLDRTRDVLSIKINH